MEDGVFALLWTLELSWSWLVWEASRQQNHGKIFFSCPLFSLKSVLNDSYRHCGSIDIISIAQSCIFQEL